VLQSKQNQECVIKHYISERLGSLTFRQEGHGEFRRADQSVFGCLVA